MTAVLAIIENMFKTGPILQMSPHTAYRLQRERRINTDATFETSKRQQKKEPSVHFPTHCFS